jgi:hypothetical protein
LGKWSGISLAESKSTAKQSVLFDGAKTKGHTKIVKEEQEQEEFESRR